jgi:hypothetical protein
METTIEDLKQRPVSKKIQLLEDLWDFIAAEPPAPSAWRGGRVGCLASK